MGEKQKTALILLAHGTREAADSEPVHQYARELQGRTGYRVEPCVREFIEPSVPTVVGKLVKEGFSDIMVLPYFLFNSAHVRRDIANDLAEEKKKHPDVTFRIGQPLGFDSLIVDLLEKRLREIPSQG